MIDRATKRWLGEGFWVIAGQALSAIGTLAGLRLLTDLLSPRVFGEVVLVMGIVFLANGVAAGPLMQGLLRQYPEAVAANSVEILRAVVNKYLAVLVALTVAVCLAGFLLYGWFVPVSPWIGPLGGGLLTVEILRQRELTFLNAARRQRLTALWMTADVWARPALAWGVIAVTGATAVATLAGYLIASVALLFAFMPWRVKGGDGQDRIQGQSAKAAVAGKGSAFGDVQAEAARRQLSRTFLRYTLPLMPLGVVGWISGQADRYLIGGMIGVEQAGIYAALYGIVARPFLMVGATLESWMRPAYYEAVVAKSLTREKKLFQFWVVSMVGAALAGVTGFALWHEEIATVFLAAPYRSGSWLMPWVAVGYGLLVVAQVYGRVCYAHNDTKAVLLAESIGGAVSLIATVYGLMQFGLAGAAYAVPVYFGAQLIAAIVFAWRATGRGTLVLWAGGARKASVDAAR
jgi:O-antigen/teichoic acid export membrane protein